MREIPLTQGKVALVDDADYERVAAHRWHAHGRGDGQFYARTQHGPRGRQTHTWLHRFIAGESVDHVSGDGLDNRRENLRPATRDENNRNRRKFGRYGGKPTSSRFKGVSRVPEGWRAQVYLNRKCHRLGTFPTEQAAADAYDEAALRLHGEYARTNRCAS